VSRTSNKDVNDKVGVCMSNDKGLVSPFHSSGWSVWDGSSFVDQTSHVSVAHHVAPVAMCLQAAAAGARGAGAAAAAAATGGADADARIGGSSGGSSKFVSCLSGHFEPTKVSYGGREVSGIASFEEKLEVVRSATQNDGKDTNPFLFLFFWH